MAAGKTPKITDFDTLEAYVNATLAMDGPPKSMGKVGSGMPKRPQRPQTGMPKRPQKGQKMAPGMRQPPQKGQNNG